MCCNDNLLCKDPPPPPLNAVNDVGDEIKLYSVP